MMKDRMHHSAYSLDEPRRKIVLEAMQEVCRYRNWGLLAAHVRPKHAHAVVEAEVVPETILNKFKSYGSRRLNRSHLEKRRKKRWTRGGSKLYLWTNESVESAIDYVLHKQGTPMAIYPSKL